MQTSVPTTRAPHAFAYFVIALLSVMLILQQVIQPLSWLHIPLADALSLPLQSLTIAHFAYDPQTPFVAPWRWLTTHLVHLDWVHALTNMTAFVAVCVIFSPLFSLYRLIAVLVVGALGACAVHTLAEPVASFAGFSALTHALVAFCAVLISANYRHSKTAVFRPWVGYLLLIALVCKLGYELSLPAQTLHWLGASAAVYAHLGGAIGGAIGGAVVALWGLHKLKQASSD